MASTIQMYCLIKTRRRIDAEILHKDAVISATLFRIHCLQWNCPASMHHPPNLTPRVPCWFGENSCSAPRNRFRPHHQRRQLIIRYSAISFWGETTLPRSIQQSSLRFARHLSICAKPTSLQLRGCPDVTPLSFIVDCCHQKTVNATTKCVPNPSNMH